MPGPRLVGRLPRPSLALAVLLGLLVPCLVAGQGPPANGNQQPVRAPAGPPPTASMEVPLRLIAEARQAYQGVSDYTCLLVKRERLRGQLQQENLIAMKVRTQPFSVYLRWLRPQELSGQEACYVAGRNNGMMRVHSKGLIGAIGFVSLDPRDPRALENSRHTINEAGIGNLIERFSQRWDLENRLNRTVVRVADYDYDKRRCVRVETTHIDNPGRQFAFYQSIVYFDKQSHLPIRVENYDWPTAANGTPNLAESYSYVDLKLNVGLTDVTFNH
jgi:hypothetical protein